MYTYWTFCLTSSWYIHFPTSASPPLPQISMSLPQLNDTTQLLVLLTKHNVIILVIASHILSHFLSRVLTILRMLPLHGCPQIEDSYRKIITVDGNKVTVEILDTAGTEQVRDSQPSNHRNSETWDVWVGSSSASSPFLFCLFSSPQTNTTQFVALHSLYVKSGDGFLLVFALNTLDSIHELEALHESIVRIKEAEGYTDKIPIVLCGNKCDLEERTVQRSWAVGLSQEWGGVPYYETSARKRINVEEVIADLVRQIIKADRLGHLGGGGGNRSGLGGKRRRGKRITPNGGCMILWLAPPSPYPIPCLFPSGYGPCKTFVCWWRYFEWVQELVCEFWSISNSMSEFSLLIEDSAFRFLFRCFFICLHPFLSYSSSPSSSTTTKKNTRKQSGHAVSFPPFFFLFLFFLLLLEGWGWAGGGAGVEP